MRLITGLAVTALLIGVLFLSAGAARADLAISVSPTLAEFTADPGGSIVQPITLSNEGSDEINMSVTIQDLFKGRGDLSATGWFDVNPDRLNIQPGETKEVDVRISVPEDASPGGRYVAIVFQSGAGVDTGQAGFVSGGAAVGARIESVFMVTVKPIEKPTEESGGESGGLALSGGVVKLVPIARAEDTLGFRVEIQNTGNVHFYPTGTVDVVDEDGNVVGQVTLPETPPVYPGTSRSFELTGTINLPPADYSAVTKVGYGWEEWQADLLEEDPEEWTDKETESELTFNSEPKLMVVGLDLVAQEGQPLRVDVQLENIGDVEVEPAGWVAVFNEKGEQAFVANLSQGALPIPPRSTVSTSVESNSAIPKGEYTVETALNYHGAVTLEQTSQATVKQDIIPPTPPPRPTAPTLTFNPDEGTPLWVWGIAGLAVPIVAATAAIVIVRRRRPAVALETSQDTNTLGEPDTGDESDTRDAPDTVDEPDTPDESDNKDAPDTTDEPDTRNAPDSQDSSDSGEAPDAKESPDSEEDRV